MSNKSYQQTALAVLDEIKDIILDVNVVDIQQFSSIILSANRVYFAGAGRSKLMLAAIAMRLMQLGFDVHFVGEVTAPAITKNDALIVASGSGETSTMVCVADKAKRIGATICLITSCAASTLGKMSQISLVLSSGLHSVQASRPLQIGAAAFEQAVLIVGDVLSILLAKELGITDTNDRIQKMHANLE